MINKVNNNERVPKTKATVDPIIEKKDNAKTNLFFKLRKIKQRSFNMFCFILLIVLNITTIINVEAADENFIYIASSYVWVAIIFGSLILPLVSYFFVRKESDI